MSQQTAPTSEISYVDPGPLIDGDLELVVPSERWLDALMAAQGHPLTQQLMPAVAQTTRQQQLEFLGTLRNGGFYPGNDASGHVPAYHFWMRRRGGNRRDDDDGALPIVGGMGLRIGHTQNIRQYIGHIGYQVFPFARGHHYAERACRLVLPLARRFGLDPLWITCNPDNLASRRTCERLGGVLVETVELPPDHPLYQRGERHKCRYRV